MSKKKTTSPARPHRYTARAKDLKILGYVEAANDKDALKKARRLYDAASVELHGQASTEQAPTPQAPAAKATKASTAKTKKPTAAKASADAAAPAAAETVAAAAPKDQPKQRQVRD